MNKYKKRYNKQIETIENECNVTLIIDYIDNAIDSIIDAHDADHVMGWDGDVCEAIAHIFLRRLEVATGNRATEDVE